MSGICRTDPAGAKTVAIPPQKRAFGVSGLQKTGRCSCGKGSFPQSKPKTPSKSAGSIQPRPSTPDPQGRRVRPEIVSPSTKPLPEGICSHPSAAMLEAGKSKPGGSHLSQRFSEMSFNIRAQIPPSPDPVTNALLKGSTFSPSLHVDAWASLFQEVGRRFHFQQSCLP